jgi:hypothetical protein
MSSRTVPANATTPGKWQPYLGATSKASRPSMLKAPPPSWHPLCYTPIGASRRKPQRRMGGWDQPNTDTSTERSPKSATFATKVRVIRVSYAENFLQISALALNNSADRPQISPHTLNNSAERLQFSLHPLSNSAEHAEIGPHALSNSENFGQIRPHTLSNSADLVKMRDLSRRYTTPTVRFRPQNARSGEARSPSPPHPMHSVQWAVKLKGRSEQDSANSRNLARKVGRKTRLGRQARL